MIVLSPAAGNHAQARRFANAANRWEKPIDVKVEHVVRRFRDTYALKDVSLDIQAWRGDSAMICERVRSTS